jgi:hypothetical protein
MNRILLKLSLKTLKIPKKTEQTSYKKYKNKVLKSNIVQMKNQESNM